MSVLSVRNLVTELRDDGGYVRIVRDISFNVEMGEFVGLVGESGSGKSITARSIVRLLPPGARCQGEVVLDGTSVLDLDSSHMRELRIHRVSMIFQDPRSSIDPLYRCGDHLFDALRTLMGMDRVAAKQRALSLLTDVGIADPQWVYRSYPGELSGGMLQRVMIAGALASEASFLIADEPTTALDVTIQAEIMAILEGLRREKQLATLFITHDLELASMICDRILVMYAGLVVEGQSTVDIFAAPLHPYTAGLLRARPILGRRRERLEVIPGRPPHANEIPDGCPFSPRCSFAQDECSRRPAALCEVSPGKFSACWRSSELAGQLKTEAST